MKAKLHKVIMDCTIILRLYFDMLEHVKSFDVRGKKAFYKMCFLLSMTVLGEFIHFIANVC